MLNICGPKHMLNKYGHFACVAINRWANVCYWQLLELLTTRRCWRADIGPHWPNTKGCTVDLLLLIHQLWLDNYAPMVVLELLGQHTIVDCNRVIYSSYAYFRWPNLWFCFGGTIFVYTYVSGKFKWFCLHRIRTRKNNKFYINSP